MPLTHDLGSFVLQLVERVCLCNKRSGMLCGSPAIQLSRRLLLLLVGRSDKTTETRLEDSRTATKIVSRAIHLEIGRTRLLREYKIATIPNRSSSSNPTGWLKITMNSFLTRPKCQRLYTEGSRDLLKVKCVIHSQ